MIRLAILFVLCVVSWCCSFGCSAPQRADEQGVVLFIPGVSGDGAWYNDLKQGLRDGGMTLPIESVSWGMPPPLFAFNFSNPGVHDEAERKLATRIAAIRKQFPGTPLHILTHSAGGGVALGAMKRLPADISIDRAVLLHPSVSPEYGLGPALAHVGFQCTAFCSDRDTTFLKWRTSTFGTYDGIKTPAAGHLGFVVDGLSFSEAEKFRQIAYDPSFERLGNTGGHFGPTARRFAAEVIAPLLESRASKP